MAVVEPINRRVLERRWVTVGGLRMHARVADQPAPLGSPTVVLVHGVGVSGRYMVPLAERLARDFRVYVPDLPGFGRSDKPPNLLDIPGLADALAGWMHQTGLGPATLVGNSLGCQVIVDLAVRNPDLVERAIFVGPTTDPRIRNVIRLLGRAVLAVPHESFSLVPILVGDYLRAGPIRTLGTLQAGVDDPLLRKVPRVRVPILVIRGDRDPIAPRRWVRELAGRLPDGRWTEVAGVAHAAHFSAPDRVAAIVRAFIREPSAV